MTPGFVFLILTLLLPWTRGPLTHAHNFTIDRHQRAEHASAEIKFVVGEKGSKSLENGSSFGFAAPHRKAEGKSVTAVGA